MHSFALWLVYVARTSKAVFTFFQCPHHHRKMLNVACLHRGTSPFFRGGGPAGVVRVGRCPGLGRTLLRRRSTAGFKLLVVGARCCSSSSFCSCQPLQPFGPHRPAGWRRTHGAGDPRLAPRQRRAQRAARHPGTGRRERAAGGGGPCHVFGPRPSSHPLLEEDSRRGADADGSAAPSGLGHPAPARRRGGAATGARCPGAAPYKCRTARAPTRRAAALPRLLAARAAAGPPAPPFLAAGAAAASWRGGGFMVPANQSQPLVVAVHAPDLGSATTRASSNHHRRRQWLPSTSASMSTTSCCRRTLCRHFWPPRCCAVRLVRGWACRLR